MVPGRICARVGLTLVVLLAVGAPALVAAQEVVNSEAPTTSPPPLPASVVSVPNFHQGILLTLDPMRGEIIGVSSLEHFPYQSGTDYELGRSYYPDFLGGTLTAVDLASGAVVSVVDLEGGPYAVSVHPDTHQVYVSTALMNTMVVLDGHSLHVTATIPLASQPGGLALDAVRDRLFIAHAREGALTEVALHSGQVLGTLPAGAWPSGIAIDPSSGWVCVVDRDAETLTLVDPSERSVAATLSLTPGEQVARAD